METVALGGTFQAGNWSRIPDANDSNFITSGAAEWEPSFKVMVIQLTRTYYGRWHMACFL